MDDQIKKNEMGGACSKYAGRKEVNIGFGWGNMKEGYNSGNPGVYGRIILKWFFKKEDEELGFN
jgi:hypothetical protein